MSLFSLNHDCPYWAECFSASRVGLYALCFRILLRGREHNVGVGDRITNLSQASLKDVLPVESAAGGVWIAVL